MNGQQTSAVRAGVLPTDIANVQIKSRMLTADVVVSVLDIEDTSTSRFAQIEAIERIEAGEEIRGREVIRTVPIMNDNDNSNGSGSTSTNTPSGLKKSMGPHKLLLQDSAGTRVYGFELVKVPQISISNGPEPAPDTMRIGAKMILKEGTAVRRGIVMLEPGRVVVLGGTVEAWDKKWRADRKMRLNAAIDGLEV